MLKKLSYVLILLLVCKGSFAQSNEINAVKTKYVNWLLGDDVNYADKYVLARYNQFLISGNNTKTRNFSDYNFSSPGAPWNFKNFKDQALFANLLEKHLINMVFLYQIKGPSNAPNLAYHRVSLRDSILTIFNYIKAKGVSSTSDFDYKITNQDVSARVALRTSAYATSILLMKDELKRAGQFDHHMGALDKITVFASPEFGNKIGFPNYPTNPGMNVDLLRAGAQQRFCYVLAQDDNSNAKLGNMQFLIKFLNTALQISNGWHDGIKPDFVVFHHRGVYANSYGGVALVQASILNMILKSTAYELEESSQSNLKNAVMNYTKFCADLTMPRGINGRFPSNVTINDVRQAYAHLYVADPVANLDAGQEFKRLWNIAPENLNGKLAQSTALSAVMMNSLGAMQDMSDIVTSVKPGIAITEGQFGFPYAGLSVHKYKGYQASVKGTSKYIWHFENGPDQNLYGQYSSAGAMELLTLGTPKTHEANGSILEGFDWAHVPGTTVANVPFSVMNKAVAREYNGKEFLGLASLDNQGVFAIDYKDFNLETEMTALKSYFFFDDKILCLGSNIQNANGSYPIHTTLFQTAFNAKNTSIVNGKVVSGNNYSLNHTAGSLWATDAAGNGYVLPQNAVNNNNIVITRSSQTTPLENSATLTATSNFLKAYINHGVAPSASAYRYAIWMKGQEVTENMAKNFDKYFNVIKQDKQAHVAQYVPNQTYAYVIFDPSCQFSVDVVKKVDMPSVVMTRKINGGNNVKISLTNPNLGLLAANETPDWETVSKTASILYRASPIKEVTLTLTGKWTLNAPTKDVRITINETETMLTFNTVNSKTIQIELVKAFN